MILKRVLISQDVDTDEMERRQVYLKEQRDKLIALKKDVHQGRLRAEMKKSKRPKTAKAVEESMSGKPGTVDIDEDTLELRKALAMKLRKEIVDNTDQ
jgi:hypothetical protein